MAITYEPIATQTLSSGVSSVTFSSIPQTYTDLFLACSFQANETSSTGDVRISMQLNSDTGSNYSSTSLWGDGASAITERRSNRSQIDFIFQIATANTNEFGTIFYTIMNYSNATTYKTVLYRQNTVNYQLNGHGAGAAVGLWRDTSAVNSIRVYKGVSGLFSVGSTFTLYGIKAAV